MADLFAIGARVVGLLTVVFLIAFLAGCGGSDSSTGSHPTVQPPPQESAEESIESLGAEAEGALRAEMLEAFHGYLQGIANGDFAMACRWLGSAPQRTLAHLVGDSNGGFDCAAAMRALLPPESGQLAAQQDGGEVTKVRVDGQRGVIVFRAPGATSWEMPVLEESGGWRVGAANAGVLAP